MPTSPEELNELKDRVARLPLGDQLYLFELVLGEYRRQVEAIRTSAAAQIEVHWEAEQKHQSARLPAAA